MRILSLIAVLVIGCTMFSGVADARCGKGAGLFQSMHNRKAARHDAKAAYHDARATQISVNRGTTVLLVMPQATQMQSSGGCANGQCSVPMSKKAK